MLLIRQVWSVRRARSVTKEADRRVPRAEQSSQIPLGKQSSVTLVPMLARPPRHAGEDLSCLRVCLQVVARAVVAD
jgi:hypothetical protein